MALDRSGISVEGRTLLSSLKSRDFNITVRVLLTEPKLSVSEIIQMTASKALDGTHCILPSRASLGTEVNVIADGFSSIPEGLNDYPSGHTVLLLVTPNGGSEVCLMGASCDETIVADSRLHLLINLEETDGIFNPSVDFDSYVPQGIINDMFSSMKDSLDQYVTVGTKQTVTGQKVFTGTINVSSPSDADNVYLQIQTGGDKKQSPVSSLYFWDTHRNVLGGVGFESSGNGTNQFLTSYVRRYDNNYNTFVSGVVDQKVVSNHYNVLVDDSCVFFESPSSSDPLVSSEPPVGAWHEAARALSDYYAESTDTRRKQAATYSNTDDYRERIRLRKVLYQEQITDTPKGTVKTYVDLYAQNITNVADTVKFQYTENETYTLRLWNDQAGDVVDTPITGPVPHDLLTISKDGGVYSTHFRGGYEIDNTSYSFGSAGSLTFETSVPVNADNAHLPTSLAVKDYVDSSVSSSMNTSISGLNLGTASTKNFSTDMNTPANLPTTSAITSYISNQGFATTSQIPTKTSELTNDSGFITSLYTARAVDGVSFDGSTNITHYGTCYTASGTGDKTVTVTGFVLETGARVTVKFSHSNTAANPTLNVHNGSAYTGAKAIMYRGTSSVSDSSDYYRWQGGDIIDFIYDGTNWVMVGWQTYAHYAESATSASTSTYATYLRYLTTDLLTASDTSTVTSSATIIPSSNGGSSLGIPRYKWGAVYANFIGSSNYPVSTAYIDTMQGTASRATSDASGNIIKSTYLKSVTLVNSSGTNLTSSGTAGVNETGNYVVPSKWPVLLRLTKGSDTTTDIGLRSLLCSYLMGIPHNNASTSSSSPLGVSGAIGCLAILQVYRTSPSDTIPRGRLVSSYRPVSVRGIETAGESGYLEWSSHPASISGTWVAINHTTASSGSYNYCMVLAVRIY